MKPLRNFFMEEFRELYRREKRWLIILPEVARHMPPPDVERAVVEHLEQTAAQVIRLEEIFEFIEATDRRASQSVKPLLNEAGNVLTAVTRSTAALRKQAVVQPFVHGDAIPFPMSKYQN